MRELKFRVWDGEKMGDDLKAKWNLHTVDHELYSGKVIMQWTGLKDKNGKEIYEGDIIINPLLRSLQCPHCGEFITENRPTLVKWDNFNSKWEKPYIDYGQYYEILGNIYENPELLEKSL